MPIEPKNEETFTIRALDDLRSNGINVSVKMAGPKRFVSNVSRNLSMPVLLWATRPALLIKTSSLPKSAEMEVKAAAMSVPEVTSRTVDEREAEGIVDRIVEIAVSALEVERAPIMMWFWGLARALAVSKPIPWFAPAVD